MSVGQISGPLLTKNLLRNGVDLSFETDLLYLDVSNSKIGIKTQYPSRELEINNTVKTTNIIVDTDAKIANIEIDTTGIARTTGIGDINLNAVTQIVADNIATDSLLINDSLISATPENTDIELRPTSNKVQIRSNLDATGGIHVTNNVTFDGTITFGNSTSDNISFNSDVASDLIPTLDNVKVLGTTNKRWKNTWFNTATIDHAEATTLITDDDVNYASRTGNTYYVSSEGLDTNQGNHPNSPFATIKHALSLATVGWTVVIYPGTYYEDFPLTVPAGVTVDGYGIRAVNIKPTSGTNYEDCFLLNGECTVQNLTVSDFYGDSTGDTGYVFRFDNDFNVQSRSPYVQNVSAITNNNLPPNPPSGPSIYVDPGQLGFSTSVNSVTIPKAEHSQSLVESWVGNNLVAWFNDVSFYTITGVISEPDDPTNLWRIEFDTAFDVGNQGWGFSIYPEFNQALILGSEGYEFAIDNWMSFRKTSLPPFFSTTVGAGWTLEMVGQLNTITSVVQDPDSIYRWRVYFDAPASTYFGPPIFSPPLQGVTYRVGKGALIDGSVADPSSKEASMLFHSCTFVLPGSDAITMKNGVRVEWLNSFTYFANRGLYALNGSEGFASQGTKFGAEIRSIGSANVYGTYGAVADGNSTLMYLINHNFAYIGAGTSTVNDPTVVVASNEAVEINNGKIYHSSINQSGDFRVGDVFTVDNATGTANINPSATKIQQDGYVNITNGTTSVFLNAVKIDANDVELSGHTIRSLIQDLNFASNSHDINLQNDTYITGNLDISNDFRLDGTLTLGNQATDTITFDSRISQDLKPKNNIQYDLGSDAVSKRWRNLYSGTMKLPEMTIASLGISSSLTNQDLLISGNGTGKAIIEGVSFSNYTIKPASAQDLSLAPDENLVIDATDSLLIPVGNSSDRPSFLDGDLRFNSEIGYFQGKNILFDGVISSDALTSLKAHPTNNSFRFSFGNTLVDFLDSNGLTVNKFKTSNITIDQNSVKTNNADLRLANLGLLDVNVQGIKISENEIENQSNLPLILSTTGPNGYVKISGTNGVVIPVGTTLEQPLTAERAQLRYNTTVPQLEIFDGLSWTPAIGTESAISAEEVAEMNFLYNLVLG